MKVSHNNLVYSLGRLRHLAHRFIEREMERRGIEGMAPSFGDVFMIVAARGPLSMKEIARLTYKDKSTITGVVRALERPDTSRGLAIPPTAAPRLYPLPPKP